MNSIPYQGQTHRSAPTTVTNAKKFICDLAGKKIEMDLDMGITDLKINWF